MKTLALLSIALLLTQSTVIKFSDNTLNEWYVLNDGVMGGLSKGKLVETDEGVVFFGSVSLSNNGGFTSYRGPWKSYDLSDYQEVEIRYRSEGMKLAFTMETSRRFWIPNYKVSLSKSKEWITKTFKLVDFKQYRLGNLTGKSFTEDVKDDIIRVGFITDEKREGDFKFEVAYAEFR